MVGGLKKGISFYLKVGKLSLPRGGGEGVGQNLTVKILQSRPCSQNIISQEITVKGWTPIDGLSREVLEDNIQMYNPTIHSLKTIRYKSSNNRDHS